MRQSTRLIINMLSTFASMAVMFVAGLLIVRYLVGTLGMADYGLLTTIGGSAVLLNTLSGALTGTSQRHLAVEIGRQDRGQLQVVFNTSAVLFLVLGLLLLVGGLAIARWLLAALPIPPARADAAFWVYHLVLVSLVVSTVLTPFQALISAHEALVLLDGMQCLSALFHLLVVLLLAQVPGDKLIAYAMLLLPIQCLPPVAATALCLIRYPDSRPRWGRFSIRTLGEVGSFAVWLSLHRLGLQLRLQGGLLLVYYFFGGVVSASYALALVLARYRENLARGMLRPTAPALAALVGRGDRDSFRRLALVANKYGAMGTLYFVVPIVLETELVFRLWLPTAVAPDPLLVRLILIWMSIAVLTRGYGMAVVAMGRLARYSFPMAAMSFGSLALAALWFYGFAAGPWALPATAIGENIAKNVFIVSYVGRRIGTTFGQWWRGSVLPVLLVVILAGVPAWSLRLWMAPGWHRLIGVVVLYGVLATVVAWTVALEGWEKAHLRRVLSTAFRIVLARTSWVK
ncbi:MAG: hypothetical protein A2W31_00055 [Planctomycetes bacterium RBG_16_64_10]|nr:MAG: hypothetical protein A2W31_00055 [Planctomycetes bacterium RBG_16_64_10]